MQRWCPTSRVQQAHRHSLTKTPGVSEVQYKEVLQKESGRRLYYIYIKPLYMHGAFPATSGASSVKIWHPPRTDREKGSELGRGRGKEWEGRKPV
jgi:hypothetical protein